MVEDRTLSPYEQERDKNALTSFIQHCSGSMDAVKQED